LLGGFAGLTAWIVGLTEEPVVCQAHDNAAQRDQILRVDSFLNGFSRAFP
jgi:hypothetical protein